MYSAPDLDWDEEFHSEPLDGIHWHCFFWKGPAVRKFSMRYSAERRPGTGEFESLDTPAEAVADNLLRPRLVKATYTVAADAGAWARRMYDENKPASDNHSPDNTEWYVRASVARGMDAVWRWDTPNPGDQTCNWVAVVCCPNRMEPTYRCPSPPRTGA